MSLATADTPEQTMGDETRSAVTPSVRTLGWLYIVAAAIGFAASFVLLLERLELIENPDYIPSCSLNPIINCGSVMTSDQASVLGFPNPLLGIAGFPILLTIGTLLVARIDLPRALWLATLAALAAAVVFVHWLIFQSLYRIGALCPYCVAVWIVVIPLLWYTALHTVTAAHVQLPINARLTRLAAGLHTVVPTVWYLGVAALIAKRFWSYWTGLL